MKKTFKKTLAALLVGVMLICSAPLAGITKDDMFSTTAQAAGCIKTQAQAVEWLKAQAEAYYDLDGSYGGQCSDFVSAYMNWLVTGNAYSGTYGVYNANYYPTAASWNTDRWTVYENYYDFLPMPGDIFVSAGNSEYGHVGVVVESDIIYATVIDQNARSGNQNAYYHTIKWSGAYAASYYIRPNFASAHTHTTVNDPAVAATCTTAGKTAGSHCSSCGKIFTAQTTIPALGHSFGSWTTTTAPTCTKSGIQTRACSRCSTKETKSVSATGHKDGEWKVTTAATVNSTGVKTLYCAVCSVAIRTEVIPKLTGGIESVELYYDNVNMNKGQTYQIDGTFSCAEGVKIAGIEFTSSNPSVAQVDEMGQVTAVNRGTATITCTVTDEYGNSKSDSCTVQVNYTFWQWLVYILFFGWIWM